MHITVIHGTQHRGSTWHIAQQVLKNLAGEGDRVQEFTLPEALPSFCVGCFACIQKGAEHCPHYAYTEPLQQAPHAADVLIFTTPVYVMRCSGQMKAFLDHFAYQFIVHRPDETMFRKRALILTTAAGAGNRSAAQDIAASLRYWGVGRIHSYGKAVRASCWEHVSPALQSKIDKDCLRLAQQMKKPVEWPSLRARLLFVMMRKAQKRMPPSIDTAYWQSKGWLDGRNPWDSMPL